MREISLMFILICTLASQALAEDLHQGFAGISWGSQCQEAFKGERWRVYKGAPLWDAKAKMLEISSSPEASKNSAFVLRYQALQQLEFEGFKLLNAFFGCHKQNGTFDLVILHYSVMNKEAIIKRAKEILGEPTQANELRVVWDLPDLLVTADVNYLIIFHATPEQRKSIQ